MIILEPIGGLANRMRVIASGIWLKDRLNTQLIIIWNENYELNCPFNKLFEQPDRFLVVKKERKYNYVKNTNQAGLIKKIYTTVINKLIGVDYCIKEDDFPVLIWPGKIDLYEVGKRNKRVYIQTCQEFGDNLYAFQFFSPIPEILRKIQKITNGFNDHTVGIHIRRTDNLSSILKSPINLFIEAMKAELDKQKETSFYLCSDDWEVKKEISAIFGETVTTCRGNANRKTVHGMQEAVIDLYCLSKTNKIFGSYWSSFSDIASRLNNSTLRVLKQS